jgi:AcrR family transcriptional regulator
MIEKGKEQRGRRKPMQALAATGVVVADGSTQAGPASGGMSGDRDAPDGGSAGGAPSSGHHTARGEEQQAALVRAAFDLIAERGFEGLRTRDVAARAGVNIATLHYYFATKEELIRGVLAAAAGQFRRREARDLGSEDRDSLTELRSFLRSRQEQMRASPELFTVLLELSTRAIRDPAIRAIMRETDQAWRANLAALLQTGVDQGTLHPEMDVEAAAASLVALSKGLHLQMIMDPDLPDDAALSAEVERWLTGTSYPS